MTMTLFCGRAFSEFFRACRSFVDCRDCLVQSEAGKCDCVRVQVDGRWYVGRCVAWE